MAARIYKPAKTAMQQGTALTREWVLEFVPDEPRTIEPLMGWTSSADTRPQVRMSFASKDEAVRTLSSSTRATCLVLLPSAMSC
ncbi:MAG TPA: NADH dehydrogenase ubiquinone Fe-S protein 4, partial [Terriglobia bacterium]|nr:NADH dehydrogenase ubiquinone Fe-S protein 4 [Terriglobia bacterium]